MDGGAVMSGWMPSRYRAQMKAAHGETYRNLDEARRVILVIYGDYLMAHFLMRWGYRALFGSLGINVALVGWIAWT